ncbi:MAG: hypothetical protein [psittacine adenovirus 7]|uniref:Sialidase domain-containing protein n=1 Tax=psittacine adenovirus 7 TaxID=2848040 RepID=A0A6B9LXN8_9ADEN|nr:MAG: hypothetical protein QKN13_gp01 [psittacine adenovirus 7]QHB43554.1 MAG: hypothetical protein [psittacine adenovirus 7]
MDFPLSISAPIPAWPLKRKVEEEPTSTNYLNPRYGPGIQVVDGETQLDVNTSLSFNNNQLAVTSNLVKPFRTQTIFQPGDFGASFFRIPVLLDLSSGGLIAAGLCKYGTVTDQERSTIAVAISTDGGLTWPAQVDVLEPTSGAPAGRYMDPCLVEDAFGIIHLFAVYFENDNHAATVDPNYDFVHTTSADGGYSWTDPQSLRGLKKPNEVYFFQCPGIGITLYNGTIVVPCQVWMGNNSFFSTIIYSTDGVNWVRATADGTASVVPPLNTNEAQIAEFPVNGQIIMVARRQGGSGLVNLTRVVVYTTDLGNTWNIHPTNATIRQTVPCMASLLRITSPAREWVLLLCAPSANNTDNEYGRSEMTLQAYTDRQMEWRLVGLVNRQPTLGYSCLAMNRVYNRLYVLLEEYVNGKTGSALNLYDISRFFGAITVAYNMNVNLGLVVDIDTQACSISDDPVLYTVYNNEAWLYGTLYPPSGGTFPDTSVTMFTFAAAGWFVNKGWFPVYGTVESKPYGVTVFLFEYTYASNVVTVKCFQSPATGTKLSEMKKLYIPAVRIAIFQ